MTPRNSDTSFDSLEAIRGAIKQIQSRLDALPRPSQHATPGPQPLALLRAHPRAAIIVGIAAIGLLAGLTLLLMRRRRSRLV